MNNVVLNIIEQSLKQELPKWEITVRYNPYLPMNIEVSMYSERINFKFTYNINPEYYHNIDIDTITKDIIDQLNFYIINLLF